MLQTGPTIEFLQQDNEALTPRAGHSICRIQDKYVVFGGANHEQGFLNDILSFGKGIKYY
jgi:hypothetical protein